MFRLKDLVGWNAWMRFNSKTIMTCENHMYMDESYKMDEIFGWMCSMNELLDDNWKWMNCLDEIFD